MRQNRAMSPAANDFSPAALRAVLDGPGVAAGGGAAGARWCVALSGGLDSTVLLEAMCRLRDQVPAGSLRAVHVHHGLHSDADAWARSCETRCARLGVPLTVLRVDARPGRGESPEARARELRYAALAAELLPGEILLTAHHADDQLETVLIQLLRGAGVAGLAAMPADASFGPGRHCRPLLGFTRVALRAWAAAERLPGWVEDPANEALRFARNHLRSEVLPAVRAHWPAAASAVSRSARHCAEAAGLLDELAAMDAAACADGDTLVVSGLRRLSPGRCRNLVRWQARRLGLAVPDERRLATLVEQVLDAAPDTHPEIRWAGVVALRHADRLWMVPEACLPPPLEELAWPEPREPLALGPGLGTLELVPSDSGGLSAAALAAAPWRVVGRHGGERLRLPGREGSRALKKLLQAAGFPPWVRARIPLLEIDGQLAAAGPRWIDRRWWAPSGDAAWRLRWRDCRLPGGEDLIVGERTFC